MKASTASSSGEVSNARIFAAASARDGRSILGAVAVVSVWALLLVAFITGVVRPLGDSFADAAAGDRMAQESSVSDPPAKSVAAEEPAPASQWTARRPAASTTCVE